MTENLIMWWVVEIPNPILLGLLHPESHRTMQAVDPVNRIGFLRDTQGLIRHEGFFPYPLMPSLPFFRNLCLRLKEPCLEIGSRSCPPIRITVPRSYPTASIANCRIAGTVDHRSFSPENDKEERSTCFWFHVAM